MAGSRDIEMLLAIVDQAYGRRSWHGTNLRGSVRGVASELASWRPGPGRHNIWEIVVHAAYWKYAVARRLTGGRRGSFPLTGSNWFRRPDQPTAAAWRADLALLGRMHTDLRAAIAATPPSALQRRATRDAQTLFWVVSGAAAHDVYHAGQIQLIRKLAGP